MSYCRFSSNNFKSDIYLYDSNQGLCLHIAANRIVGEPPAYNLMMVSKLNDYKEGSAEYKSILDEFMAAQKAHNDFMETVKREYINFEHAGQTFYFSEANECAEFLRQLIALGYHVPEGVIEAVIEDGLLGG
jgi:hypothetical protein